VLSRNSLLLLQINLKKRNQFSDKITKEREREKSQQKRYLI
jgi:hypothetical protein